MSEMVKFGLGRAQLRGPLYLDEPTSFTSPASGYRRWRPTDVNPGSSARAGVAAPVSHQKRPNRSATNAIGLKQKDSKIDEADRYPAAHNGLVAGSSPAGPTSKINCLVRD